MNSLQKVWQFSKRKWRWIIALPALLLLYVFCLPESLFQDPYSTVLQAKGGELLAASIAKDGQWRFPPSDELPVRYKEALVLFEDKRFYHHPGIDILSLARAFRQNVKAKKIISGGSTISMQVIRLSRKGKSRTILEKIRELILATRLELRYSKEEILSLYSAHAPFGGNVVGIQAACWRFFGRSEKELSWAEASLLAVLPNSPSMIHPGKNRLALRKKRDLLLDRLLATGKIDSITCWLSKAEPIPEKPVALPRYARHLLSHAGKTGHGESKIISTIDFALQQQVEEMLHQHHQRLRGNQIHNAAALVAEVNSGQILAYVGNVGTDRREGVDVDIIHARRSTGSILKPFLYAALLDEGTLLPEMLLPDIPTFINGFTPKNFSRQYDGAVPADKALIRSLNIPAVHMLKDFRYERFHTLLKQIGMTTLNNPPDHYGLSLILGGAEGTLWDITGMYASMARTLNNYFTHPGRNRYDKNDYRTLQYTMKSSPGNNVLSAASWLSASSAYQTFDVLKELYRPGEESGWRYFESSKRIAWKTGTSFGFRDGWAIGVTPEFVVGVWVGNADGEGRPGLTGTDAAAPLLFDIFSQLDTYTWFRRPASEMEMISVCRKSGFRNSANCPEADTVWVGKAALESLPCPYHRKVYLSDDKKFQVNNICAPPSGMIAENWFVLPPIQEYYFKSRNISYKPLPPFRKDCPSSGNVHMMDLIYPKPESRVFIPRDISGRQGNAVFHLAHRNINTTVFWHIDGEYIGSTRKTHNLPVNLPPGKHTLLVIDEQGMSLEQEFEVLPNL